MVWRVILKEAEEMMVVAYEVLCMLEVQNFLQGVWVVQLVE